MARIGFKVLTLAYTAAKRKIKQEDIQQQRMEKAEEQRISESQRSLEEERAERNSFMSFANWLTSRNLHPPHPPLAAPLCRSPSLWKQAGVLRRRQERPRWAKVIGTTDPTAGLQRSS
ncbi:hypothetical protein SKAU_G00064270 [Synaphobranchus kaupii]|uniref:Uncharacterized protein n=1 Tax=Synaphobranchus kaupii TaxID=118154 RepID=A0A9Q1G5J4_SYNKA|nr:hypothetical protein SKAU_G00064270 [Synaphobranchus kaupii]